MQNQINIGSDFTCHAVKNEDGVIVMFTQDSHAADKYARELEGYVQAVTCIVGNKFYIVNDYRPGDWDLEFTVTLDVKVERVVGSLNDVEDSATQTVTDFFEGINQNDGVSFEINNVDCDNQTRVGG